MLTMSFINVKTAAIGQWREAEVLVIFCLKAQTVERMGLVLEKVRTTTMGG
jgi:hypothetical protein